MNAAKSSIAYPREYPQLKPAEFKLIIRTIPGQILGFQRNAVRIQRPLEPGDILKLSPIANLGILKKNPEGKEPDIIELRLDAPELDYSDITAYDGTRGGSFLYVIGSIQHAVWHVGVPLIGLPSNCYSGILLHHQQVEYSGNTLIIHRHSNTEEEIPFLAERISFHFELEISDNAPSNILTPSEFSYVGKAKKLLVFGGTESTALQVELAV